MAVAAAKTYDDLETRLRAQLADTDVSLRALESETGISKTHLANFKNGKRNLSFQNLDTLARHFGVRYVLKNF